MVFPPEALAERSRNRQAMRRWKVEHCPPSTEHPYPLPKEPLDTYGASAWMRDHWAPERQMVEPPRQRRWESCMSDLAPPADPKKSALLCRIVEIPRGYEARRVVVRRPVARDPIARGQKNELLPKQGNRAPADLFFTAQHHRRWDLDDNLLPILRRQARLRRNLEVQGAECETTDPNAAGWRRGKIVPTGWSTLRCRRLDPASAAPVRLVLETTIGTCTAALP